MHRVSANAPSEAIVKAIAISNLFMGPLSQLEEHEIEAQPHA